MSPENEGNKSDKLQEHVFDTYLSLRDGLAVIGLLFPFVLIGVGYFFDGAAVQRSISAYYWTTKTEESGEYWARAFLVGGLFAVALGLYLYKGYTKWEDRILNAAALFALGIALFPTTKPSQAGEGLPLLHGTCAVLLFVCLAYVVVYRARDTLYLLTISTAARRFRTIYIILGAVMLASPVTALLFNLLTPKRDMIVLLVEVMGVLAFSIYWFFKSLELRKIRASKTVPELDPRTDF